MSFTIKRIRPHIYHVNYTTQSAMVKAFLRFESYYECPKFHGKEFTTEQYRQWYESDYAKRLTPSGFADGLNMPAWVLQTFPGQLEPAEAKFLKQLRLMATEKDYYVIVTHSKSHKDTLRHELAHAFYYTNFTYRWKARLALLRLGFGTIKLAKWLFKQRYGFPRLVDEMHAWLAADYAYMKDNGCTSADLSAVSGRLGYYLQQVIDDTDPDA